MFYDDVIKMSYSVFSFFTDLIPDFSSVSSQVPNLLNSSWFNISKMLFEFVGYILPLNTLITVFTISLSIQIFKVAWGIFLRGKSFVPTMGR